MDIDFSTLPPPPVISEELQAQMAELTRRAAEQLQALLQSLRQAEQQLGAVTPVPETPPETPPATPPKTGGLDPLPAGEDDGGAVIGISLPFDPPIFVGDAPPKAPDPKDLAADEGGALSRSAVMPNVALAATATAVEAAAQAVDDFVPIAAPAAIEEWVTPPAAIEALFTSPAAPAPAAAASVAEQPVFPAFVVHEFRAGAEGQAA